MQRVVNLVSVNYSSKWLAASPKSIPKTNNNNKSSAEFLKNNPQKHLLKLRNNNNNNNNNTIMTKNRAVQEDVVVASHNNNNKEVEEEDRESGEKGEEEKRMKIIPKHVAIILDGNRRWLKEKGLDLDYRPFFKSQIKFADCCLKWGVPTATAYLYGLNNIQRRTQEEIDFFLGQFETFLEEELEYFMWKGIKISIVGDTSKLPESCRAKVEKVEEATKNNTKLEWTLPICYTAQWDILEATKKILNKLKQGTLEVEDVNEDLIEQHLSLLVCGSGGSKRPPLDLFIRMGGHLRVGGLLGWDVAHVELYFTDTFAPDFGEHVFLDALNSFQHRQKWFGK